MVHGVGGQRRRIEDECDTAEEFQLDSRGEVKEGGEEEHLARSDLSGEAGDGGGRDGGRRRSSGSVGLGLGFRARGEGNERA